MATKGGHPYGPASAGRRRGWGPAALCAILGLALAKVAGAQEGAPAPATLLDACWSAEALRGRAEERASRRPLPADRLAAPAPEDADLPARPATGARSIRSVSPRDGEKLVALTFDLCEQAGEVSGYDGALVDLLRAEQARVTFYAGGKWMRSHPERAMQLMADPLFEIGNHGWTHANLRLVRGGELEAQIRRTQVEYARLRGELLERSCAAPLRAAEAQRIPPLPATFRFPYGACDTTALQSVAAAGLRPVQWNIVSGDPVPGLSADRMFRAILAQLRPGSIVVAHANGRGHHTAEAMQRLIPALRGRGYRLVTVSELLAAGREEAVEACYELAPGDNLKYDRLFARREP